MQLFSQVPGKAGSYLRIALCRFTLVGCDKDCFIGFATLFSQRDTVIGRGVYIGPQCNIGACRIGDDTLIASGVHIMSGTGQHRFDDLAIPIRDQGGEFVPVNIGRDCWIGNGALIMADIGDHCVIGAGSVVTRPIPDYAIAVGNPARVVRSRLDEASGEQAPQP
ncbi:MAG: acyltransferase [Pseudohaliea sp.]